MREPVNKPTTELIESLEVGVDVVNDKGL